MMRILTPCLIMFGILGWPGMAAAINFSNGVWSTSFDYDQECSQHGNLGNANCGSVSNDGIYWNWGAQMQGGRATQAVSAANNPNGNGGLGFRSWVGDGTNIQTGEARIDFPGPQKELWISWYQRYQAGFTWSGAGGNPGYDKTLYMNTGGSLSVFPQHGGNAKWSLTILGGGNGTTYQATTNPGLTWANVFGASSDGQFHLFEIHIKLDTNGNNGVGQMWIDGNLVINASGINFSGGSSASRQGFTWIEFHSNQTSPANGGPAYVDYDDFVIYNRTPPNFDGNGNPWIGPLNGSTGGGGSPVPNSPAPVGVSFYDPVEDNNFASRSWYDKTNMVLANSGATSGSTKSIEYRFNSGAIQTIR